MAGKPTVSLAMVRRKIRAVLKIRPGRGKTEAIIHESVNELVAGGVSLQEIRDGLEFNHAENFIRSHFNKESEETEWFITDDGAAQES